MRPLGSAEIRGNWCTLLLPINRDDSIDYPLLEAEIDAFIAARVSGVYSNGSAGEFYTQTEEEFDRINQLLAEKCERADLPFQIGASHTSAQISRARIRRAKAWSPSAFQVVLPDWFIPSWPEILAFLETLIAEAAPIPLVLYNPPHAKRRLTPEEWGKLAATFPGLVGIKVAGGDHEWYQAMQPVMARLAVFIPGHTLATGIGHGAQGAYSNVACLHPAGAQRWYELIQRDPAEGERRQESLARFWINYIRPLITERGLANMAADKAAAAAGGWLPGLSPRLRWPYRGADEALIPALAAAARREVPWFFAAG